MSKEDLKEIQAFGDSIGLQDKPAEDFPYALKIEDIDLEKDRELVLEVLKGSGLALDLKTVQVQLESGHLLISQMNEAKAATLVDQLKDIDADIRFGLLDELSEKKSLESVIPPGSRGASGRSHVILTTAPTLPGKKVKEYLGLASAEIRLSEDEADYDAGVEAVSKVITEKARQLGADAVIAISFQFKEVDQPGHFAVFGTGTAVRLAKELIKK